MTAVLTTLLYLGLALGFGIHLVSLVRSVPLGRSARRRRLADGDRDSTSLVISVLTCALCLWLVPDLRPAQLGEAWRWTWIDLVPVVAGAGWALRCSPRGSLNPRPKRTDRRRTIPRPDRRALSQRAATA